MMNSLGVESVRKNQPKKQIQLYKHLNKKQPTEKNMNISRSKKVLEMEPPTKNSSATNIASRNLFHFSISGWCFFRMFCAEEKADTTLDVLSLDDMSVRKQHVGG